MADFSTSDLWWLRQEKPESAVPALALGAQLAQHRMDAQRQAEQIKVSTAMKMMDLMMEQQRNDLSLKTFKVKQDADLLRAKGMTEIGDYLSQATATGMLTDPDTQAGFWSLTSKYAPYINEQTVNSMWDNTFKAAMDRDDRAKGLSGRDQPADIQKFNMEEKMLAELEAEQDPDKKKVIQNKLDRFRRYTGVVAPGQEVEFHTIKMPDGTEQTYYPGRRGEPIFVKTYDATKITDKLKLARFQSAIRSYDKLWETYDPSILSADGKTRDPQKLIELKEKAYQEALPKSPNAIDATPVKPGGAAQFRFDPATKKLVPVK